MDCTRRFLGFQWQGHRWRKRVAGTEVITAEEPDMWARPVQRDYIRCDKAEVCEVCGKTRHPVSCICDIARGEACRIRLEYLQQPEARR
jgi:hypothetical protein